MSEDDIAKEKTQHWGDVNKLSEHITYLTIQVQRLEAELAEAKEVHLECDARRDMLRNARASAYRRLQATQDQVKTLRQKMQTLLDKVRYEGTSSIAAEFVIQDLEAALATPSAEEELVKMQSPVIAVTWEDEQPTTETGAVCPCAKWWGSQCESCKAQLPNLNWGNLPLSSYHSIVCKTPGCHGSGKI